MKYITDFHIHSKYARACSPDLTLKNIDRYCAIKGVDIVATGDFTHPKWFQEIKGNLIMAQEGLYKVRGSEHKTRFICSTEISCIYSKGGKVRRLHILVVVPSIEVIEKVNAALSRIGNLAADGRPILGLDAKRLAQIVWEIDERSMIIPAHIWTPWFSIFGSRSGFDSLQECYEELSSHIFALETGLSSDPLMNWQLSSLDKYVLVSNSDAHSLPNIGREANVFEIPENEVCYEEIRRILQEKDKKRFLFTIEFFPEEGMYHWDGHRVCGVSFPPEQTKKNKAICPKCKKPVTIGVLNRVESLADRPQGYRPDNAIGFMKLVELDKIIAESLGVKGRKSKSVQKEFENIIRHAGPELDILIKYPLDELSSLTLPEIVEGIKRVREGRLAIHPGYDGKYGVIDIFGSDRPKSRQSSLF